MTTGPDIRPPATPPSPAPVKRKARWVVYAGIPAIFLTGLAGGAMLLGSTSELDAVNSSLRNSSAQIDQLQSDLDVAEQQNETLAESLEAATDQAASAGEEAAATQQRLDAREAKLNEREHSLDQREQNVDTYEDPVPSTGGDFDRAYAMGIGGDIIHDINTVDDRLRDGIGVSSALYLLSDSYGRLLDAGIPPGVDAADYYGRLTTLQTFATDAADLYDSNAMEGRAKYAVLREQTGPLLDQLNDAANTNFRLP